MTALNSSSDALDGHLRPGMPQWMKTGLNFNLSHLHEVVTVTPAADHNTLLNSSASASNDVPFDMRGVQTMSSCE